jgi:SecD/SecF fusion protein
MSKSVKYRLLAVLIVLALWMMESTPLKNQDLFSHIRKESAKALQTKVNDAEAEKLDKQLTELIIEANEDNTGDKDRELRALRKVRDQYISSEEAKVFNKIVDQAEADVKAGKKKADDSPVPMNPSEALMYNARSESLQLFKFFDMPRFSNKKVVSRLQGEVTGRLKLGIDLKGGVEFIVAFDPNELKEADGTAIEVRDKIVEVLKRRIDSKGVAEAEIRPFSENTVLVRVPVVNDEERNAIASLITRQAELQFRALHETRPNGPKQPEDIGYEIVYGKEDESGRPPEVLLLKIQPEMTGKDIIQTSYGQDQNGSWIVSKTFNQTGAKEFGQVTERFVNKRLAIVLDGVCYSAPRINTVINGGSAQIDGMDSIEEAAGLALVLQSGSLPVKINIDGESRTDATLGASSIKSGVMMTIIGVLGVMLFMMWWYRLPGLFAAAGLVINLVLLATSMMIYGATFTLPGIAGIALTLGMAVDSNVLIFERIREELATGRIADNASREGFARAFTAIFDANLTTFISALILYNFGTGPIQGFAITLSIGIITTMFTAIFVSRIFFDWMNNGERGDKKVISGLGESKKWNINFWKNRKKAYMISTILCVVSVVTLISKGSDALSVDFTGGTALSYQVSGDAPDQDKIASALSAELGVKSPRLAYKTAVGKSGKSLEVVFKDLPGEDADVFAKKVDALLNKLGNETGATFVNNGGESIGGLVGAQFKSKALGAMLWVMVAIFIYITFRFESVFAFGAIAALAHDALIAVGIFVLLGNQISLPIIGAVLTIMGYSLNDTIVVYDRIREKSGDIKKRSIFEIVNTAINDMLSRTIITSLTTLFVVIVLCLGGGVQEFATVLTIGIGIGTFSSIYVAAPIVCNRMATQLERITADREERDIQRQNDQTVFQDEA